MEIKMIGVDLTKNVFQVHGVDVEGRAVVQKSFTPAKFKLWILNPPSALSVWKLAQGLTIGQGN